MTDSTSPIPGQYLSSDRSNGSVTIVTQPQSQAVPERGSVRFSVTADGTPPYTFQWRKSGVDITDATGMVYTVPSVTMADNNAKFSVVVTGAQGTVTSQDAILTVIPDTLPPTLLTTKGSPNLTEVVLTFSELLDPTSAATLSNYTISSASGSLNVTAAALSAGGTQVTLTTAPQTLGTKYTVLVNSVKDTAAAPNTIAANTKGVFFPTGKLMEVNGMIVFEAESYDRNLDDLWVRNTTRGIPSGGASMVVPNGAGGNESGTKLEYDVEFAQAATYKVWYRASGDSGNDDSAWFHLDGERPAERATGNQASMTGFQPQADFVWRSDAQDAPDPFTVDIPSAGLHVVGLARREDGSFFDKFIITTDMAFTPTGFGPPETRQGAPGLPTVSLTAPAAGAVFSAGGNITISASVTADLALEIARVQFTANGNLIGEDTTSPFSITWTNVPDGIFAFCVTAIDEIGSMVTSGSTVVRVGTPPPQALLVVGTASDPQLNPSDAGIKARLESQGWQVSVVQAPVSKTGDADGKQLIITSSTVNSGDVGDKFRNTAVPVLNWEQALQDNFLMTLDTGSDRGTLDGQTQINIVKSDHPLAGGLSTGVITVTTNAQPYSWGVPNANAVIIATIADDPTHAVVYGYDKGAILINNSTPAPARRIMFFSGNDGFAAFTPEAIKLFDAAVQWASGITPKPPGPEGAKIAWVSFHSADNKPSTDAATAGFTKAVDIGYTDLLKANDHDVTRFVTTGSPDTNLLNAYDLVIISRSVPSADYQDPPETAAWNGITAPTMILGGYVLRNNRLGFTTGTTIPDTAGPIKLTVNDTAHPIHQGVTLDASNTMVNDYADLVTFNGTVQRGISVNTNPLADDGKVLATVATASEPAAGGAVIAEWQAGATMATAAGDKLGGHRLVFLTGSREASGLTSQGAGIYDLKADGAKLFLNAVNYMTGGTTPPPQLSIARGNGTVTITWSGGGTLESAASVTGPWNAVAGAASPYTTPSTAAAQFFRVRQ